MKPGLLDYRWNYLGEEGEVPQAFIDQWQGQVNCNKVVTIAYPALVNLMKSCKLCSGTTYKITGFNKNMPAGSLQNQDGCLPQVLYDDGTNSGITIYMMALSRCEMATSGYGEFYNPKFYDSQFYDDGVQLNIPPFTFCWDIKSFYGIYNPNMPGPGSGCAPQYIPGAIVFWGGHAWQNILNGVGWAVNAYQLNSQNWVKVPYTNTVAYKKVINEIKVDWHYGILIERYDPTSQIKVSFAVDQYRHMQNTLANNASCLNLCVNPIAAMEWGLGIDPNDRPNCEPDYGITRVNVTNGYFESVNLKTRLIANVDITDSVFVNNTFIGMKIENLVMSGYSVISDNSIYRNGAFGYFKQNTVKNNSSISNNTIFTYSFSNNKIENNSRFDGNITDSEIEGNVITNNSGIMNNGSSATIGIIMFTNNTLDNNSTIKENANDPNEDYLLYIANNTLQNFSNIKLNKGYQSHITDNTLLHNSEIVNCTMLESFINGNRMYGSFPNFNIEGCIIKNWVLDKFRFANNTLENDVTLENLTVEDPTGFGVQIWAYNSWNYSRFNFTPSGNLLDRCMDNVHSVGAHNGITPNPSVPLDLSSASYIFSYGPSSPFTFLSGTPYKKIFTREGGDVRLRYYDSTDQEVIVSVTA